MIAEEYFPATGISVALNRATKCVAFSKQPRAPTLIDKQKEGEGYITATWDKTCLRIDETDYPYQMWFSVENNEQLFCYFKEFISTGRVFNG